jgi:hypothetical protein
MSSTVGIPYYTTDQKATMTPLLVTSNNPIETCTALFRPGHYTSHPVFQVALFDVFVKNDFGFLVWFHRRNCPIFAQFSYKSGVLGDFVRLRMLITGQIFQSTDISTR